MNGAFITPSRCDGPFMRKACEKARDKARTQRLGFEFMTAPTIDMSYTVLDCPDPAALAEFYGKVLGWEIARADGNWVVLQGPGSLQMAFQRAADFVPLDWPSDGIKIHLDFMVDDMDATEQYVLGIGASKLEGNENHRDFTVFRDPVGHVFCLCQRD